MLIYEAVESFLIESRRLSNADLKDLIQQAADGSGDAFTKLFNNYMPILKHVARAKARGAAVADIDDIVQNVFLKFYEKQMTKVADLISSGKKDASYLTALLKLSVRNATVDANRKAAKKGMTHRQIDDVKPAGVIGDSEKHLGKESKKIVRAAFARALKSPKLNKQERQFIKKLFTGPGGKFDVASHGDIGGIAKSVGITNTYAPTKIKKKFLKLFCNDKELCDLLPKFKGRLGRARTKSKVIPGLGGNICKDVGVCTEFFWKLTGDHFLVENESTAEDLVLSWLMGVFLQGE